MVIFTKKNLKFLFLYFIAFSFNAFAISAPPLLEGKNLFTNESIKVQTIDKTTQGLVILFMSAKCPCIDSHVETIKKISVQFKNFKFFVVHSNQDENLLETQSYFKKINLPFDVIEDQNAKIADQFKALKTPHAFVINSSGEIAYQGGVTNSAHAPNADRQYLEDALIDLQAGHKVRKAEGRTLGCVISREIPKENSIDGVIKQ